MLMVAIYIYYEKYVYAYKYINILYMIIYILKR